MSLAAGCQRERVVRVYWVMSSSNFLRIEREEREGSRQYVVHTEDPKFSMELTPDGSAPDKIGRGVIKRVCVPNSWAGDYGMGKHVGSSGQAINMYKVCSGLCAVLTYCGRSKDRFTRPLKSTANRRTMTRRTCTRSE